MTLHRLVRPWLWLRTDAQVATYRALDARLWADPCMASRTYELGDSARLRVVVLIPPTDGGRRGPFGRPQAGRRRFVAGLYQGPLLVDILYARHLPRFARLFRAADQAHAARAYQTAQRSR